MQENQKTIYRALYAFAILLVLTTPLLCTGIQEWAVKMETDEGYIWSPFTDWKFVGVSTTYEKPVFSFSSFWNGEYQTAYEPYYAQDLVWRKILTGLLNQITYSLSGNTFNQTVLRGREGYLFGYDYVIAYLLEMTEWNKAEMRASLSEISELQAALAQRGIPLLLISTPSKATYYSDKLPVAYDRYVRMKNNGDYNANGFDVLKAEIMASGIPFYDKGETFKEMVDNGDLVFIKGGAHWSLKPMQSYINGLNEIIGQLLNKQLGTLNVVSENNVFGQMGMPYDRDFFNIYTNALWAKPQYYSPHITFSIANEKFSPDVFVIGGSFNTALFDTIYTVMNENGNYLWGNTLFSWYGANVSAFPGKTPVSDSTDQYEKYLTNDIFILEINESIYLPNSSLLPFVRNMIAYLNEQEVKS